MSAAPRRTKYPSLPPPTPRILNLPRRSRHFSRASRPPPPATSSTRRSPPLQNLGSLLDQERPAGFFSFLTNQHSRKEPKLRDTVSSSSDSRDERWRVEAEILRAECKFLRMERELTIKELARNRERMEASIKSALGFLASGRKKIDGSDSVTSSSEEIGGLVEKMEELHVRSTRNWGKCVHRDERRNFDRQTSVLRRRLERIEGETAAPLKDIQVITANSSDNFCYQRSHCNFTDVEMLRRKMERLSKGMSERMEEYGLLLSTSTTGGSNGRTARSVGSPHHKNPEPQVNQELEGRKCCNCKEVLARVVDQVRMETEQWNETQGMLQQLGAEMDELRFSRDIWRRRASASDHNLRTLHAHMTEWRQRALLSERKVMKLKERISSLHSKLHSARDENSSHPSYTLRPEDICVPKPAMIRAKELQQVERENEKRVLVCRLKKKEESSRKRSLPLQDISNSLML